MNPYQNKIDIRDKHSRDSEDFLYRDQDGYPTELALQLILETNPLEKNPNDLMKFVKNLWQYTNWGWKEEESCEFRHKTGTLYSLSTGGWSGNESLVNALHNNRNHFWSFYWKESHRGGHFKFFIPHAEANARQSHKEISEEGETPTSNPNPNSIESKNEDLQTQYSNPNPNDNMNNDHEYSAQLQRIFNEIVAMDLERKKYKEMFEDQIKETAKLQVENQRLTKKLALKGSLDS